MAINPGKKELRSRSGTNGRSSGRRWLTVSVLAAAVLLVVLTIWLLPAYVTAGNPRFTVRHLAVKSSGRWDGREAEMSRLIHLDRESNLFQLSPEEIREKVKKIADIEDASVRFILPDIVEVDVTERVPRAEHVVRRNGKIDHTGWYFDAKGFRFRQSETPRVQLPRLLMNGTRAPQAALDLIMTALENYSRIIIIQIEPDGNVMRVQLDYIFGENRTAYQVIFPTRPDTDFQTLFNVFQSAVFSGSEHRRRCDLSTPGRAIWY